MTKVFIFFTYSFLFLSLFVYGHLTEQVVGEHWTRTSPAPPPQRTCAAVMPGQHHSWLLPASSSGRPARFRWPRRGSVAARPPVDADMAGAGSRPSSTYGPARHGQQDGGAEISYFAVNGCAARNEGRRQGRIEREQRRQQDVRACSTLASRSPCHATLPPRSHS